MNSQALPAHHVGRQVGSGSLRIVFNRNSGAGAWKGKVPGTNKKVVGGWGYEEKPAVWRL